MIINLERISHDIYTIIMTLVDTSAGGKMDFYKKKKKTTKKKRACRLPHNIHFVNLVKEYFFFFFFLLFLDMFGHIWILDLDLRSLIMNNGLLLWRDMSDIMADSFSCRNTKKMSKTPGNNDRQNLSIKPQW